MRNLLALALAFVAILGISSCDKDDDLSTTETIDAVIIWTGDYAVDGCGYTLMAGEQKYKITNEQDVPDSYKTVIFEGTPVEVKIINYHRKERTSCMLPTEEFVVKVLEIRNR